MTPIFVMALNKTMFLRYLQEERLSVNCHRCARMRYLSSVNVCRGFGGAELIIIPGSELNNTYDDTFCRSLYLALDAPYRLMLAKFRPSAFKAKP